MDEQGVAVQATDRRLGIGLWKAKLVFIKNILIGYLTRKQVCPYCENDAALTFLGRKKLLLQVWKCERCLLIFRYPQEKLPESIAYYQNLYHSIASELPGERVLIEMMKTGFRETPFDLAAKIEVLRAVMPRVEYWTLDAHGDMERGNFATLGTT